MRDLGPLLASGRDADVYALGAHQVLRRATTGRSQAREAEVMAYAGAAGYPLPRVHEVRADGTELVMERIDGPSMLEDIARRPWTLGRHGATLARLHRDLHELGAPPWLAPFAPSPGDRLAHFDLHPLNVLLAARGPVVIDWTNAAAAPGAADVAMTWVLLATGAVEVGTARRALARLVRRRLVRALLATFDREEVAAQLDAVVSWKERDAHVSPVEVAAMRSLAAREGAAPR